jgi:DNA polymerase-3 subunit epsilon
MNFVAVDVETANADMASICSIGIAEFENGRLASEWYSLIDPQDYFARMNVSIHGIEEDMVVGAPTFAEVSDVLHDMLGDGIVVTHTHFDRVALRQSSQRWGTLEPNCVWLDSARIARRTWSSCAASGYGLANVCSLIGYEFQHHHALEDAKAAGAILLAAMAETGLGIEAWLVRVNQPIDATGGSSGAAIRRNGNPNGPMFGEVVAFTGALSIPRAEAANLAASVGCDVASSVTKKITLLVVGDMDIAKLAGHEQSSKQRKTEELISRGYPIRIIRETDFREMVSLA